MLLISMIRLLFLFFLSDRNVWWCCFFYFVETLPAADFILKNIFIVLSPYSWVSGSYFQFALSGVQDQIWKSWSRKYYTAIVVNNSTMLQFIESFVFWVILVTYNIGYIYIYIKLTIFILFLLSSTVMFFLYCKLNILRYEKIFCEIDESIAS